MYVGLFNSKMRTSSQEVDKKPGQCSLSGMRPLRNLELHFKECNAVRTLFTLQFCSGIFMGKLLMYDNRIHTPPPYCIGSISYLIHTKVYSIACL